MKRELTFRSTIALLLVCVLIIVDAWAFGVGDAVKVIANTNVRSGPGTNYSEIKDPDYSGTARSGTAGKITSGPQSANGYTWWKVDFGPGLYTGWSVQDGLQAAASSQPIVPKIALTLYVYEGRVGGPLIVGARVSGQDGGGSNFDQTTNASGYVTIFGRPGTWKFTAIRDSYQPNSWSQDIVSTCTRYAFLQKLCPHPPDAPAPTPPSATNPPKSSSPTPVNPRCQQSSELNGSQVDLTKWNWTNPLPLEYMYVSSYGGFVDPKYLKGVGKNHLGVDLLGPSDRSVPVGTPVFSVSSGRVDGKLNTKSFDDVYQSVIFIIADNGVAFVYGHVRDPLNGPLVKKGDHVAIGQQIGEIGPITSRGAWPKPHLHLGINTKGKYYYNYPREYSGWGIAPKDATSDVIKQKGWMDPVLYLCEHPAIKAQNSSMSRSAKEAGKTLRSVREDIVGKWVYANDSRLAEISTLQFEQDGTVLMVGPLGNVKLRTSDCSSGDWQVGGDQEITFRFTAQGAMKASAQIEGDKLRDFKMSELQPGLDLVKSPNAQQIQTTSKATLWNEYVSDAPELVSTMLLRIRQDRTFLAIGSVSHRWKMLDNRSVQIYLQGPTGNTIKHSTFKMTGDKLVDEVCGASYRRVTTLSEARREQGRQKEEILPQKVNSADHKKPEERGLQPEIESEAEQQTQSVQEQAQETLLYSLIEKLKDENPSVRQVTARKLGETKDPLAVQSLIDLMNGDIPYSGPVKNMSEIYYVREEAAEALGKIGDPRAVQPLLNVMKDSNHKLREEAIRALGKIKDPRAVQPLMFAVKNDEYHSVREGAIWALGEIKDPRAVDVLISALKGEIKAPSARFDTLDDWAESALSKIGERAVGPLVAVFEIALKEKDTNTQRLAEQTLGRIKDQRAVESLIVALKNEHWQIRAVAAEVLGELRNHRAIAPLITALADKHPIVQYSVEEALESITKQDFGDDPAKWKQWWDRNAEEILATTNNAGSGIGSVVSPPGSSVPSRDIAALSQQADRLLRVFTDPAPFPAPPVRETLRITAPDLVENVESLHFAALDYQFLSARSLRLAKQYVGIGDYPRAPTCIENAQRYYRIATALHRDSQATLDGTYSAVQIDTEGVKTACQTASSLGLSIMSPVLGKAVDYLYSGADYAVDWVVIDKDEPEKQALTRLLVTVLFDEVKFSQLDNQTISNYMSNRVGKKMFPIIDNLLLSEEAKLAVSRLVKEAKVTVSEEVILFQMLNSTTLSQLNGAGLRIGEKSWPQRLSQSVQQPNKEMLLYGLIQKLKDEDPNLRREAAISLMRDPRAVEPLMFAAMNDVSNSVRLSTIWILGEIGDPRPVPLLIAVLWGSIKASSEQFEELDNSAANALSKIGEPAVSPLVGAFERALEERNGNVERLAEKALKEMRDPRAVEPLIAALKNENWHIRHVAAESLEELNNQHAIESLIDALADENSLVRSSAKSALVSMTGEDIDDDRMKWKKWWETKAQERPQAKSDDLPAWVYEPLTHTNTYYSPRYPRRLRVTVSEINVASKGLVYMIAKLKHRFEIRSTIDQLTSLRNLIILEMKTGLKGELESLRPEVAEDLKNSLVEVVEKTGEIISLAKAPEFQYNLERITSIQNDIDITSRKINDILQ